MELRVENSPSGMIIPQLDFFDVAAVCFTQRTKDQLFLIGQEIEKMFFLSDVPL